MTARVKRLAVLVLTWIMVTTSATAMAWWSVTFVTKEVGDRRPLRPSDVVAASVRQVVPVPAWVYGGPQPAGPPAERTVSPVTAVVVEAIAAVPTQPASPTVPASTADVRKAPVVTVARRSPVSTTPVTVTVQVASAPQVSAKLSAPVVPVPAPRSSEVADLPTGSDLGLIPPTGSTTTVAVNPHRFHHHHRSSSSTVELAQVTPAAVDPDASVTATAAAPRRHGRHATGSTVSAAGNLPA